MIQPKLILIITLTLVIMSSLGCSTKPENNLKVIKINPAISDDQEFLKIISNIEVIPLETNDNCLLGRIWSLKTSENKFYIQTLDGNNPLYVFDQQGGFINQIGRQGRGPEEFVQLSGFLVDENITLFTTGKTLEYSLEGNFLNEQEDWFYFNQSAKIDNDLYALYYGIGTVMKNGDTPSGVVFADHDFKIKSEYTSRPEHRNRIGYHSNIFSQFRNTTYFMGNYENTICEIKPKQVIPKYLVDFGKYQINDDFLLSIMNERNPINYVRLIEKNFATYINYYHTDKYLWVKYSLTSDDKLEPHFAIYSNDDSRLLNLNMNNPLNKLFSRIEANDESGRFIFSIDAPILLECAQVIEKQLNAGLLENKNFWHQILQKSSTTKETDNPILIALTLN
jgi:hypothetical protein